MFSSYASIASQLSKCVTVLLHSNPQEIILGNRDHSQWFIEWLTAQIKLHLNFDDNNDTAYLNWTWSDELLKRAEILVHAGLKSFLLWFTLEAIKQWREQCRVDDSDDLHRDFMILVRLGWRECTSFYESLNDNNVILMVGPITTNE